MASKERMEIFRDNLLSQIERYGINRATLCDILGIPHQTMSEWIRLNRYPRVDTIDKIAQFFSIRPSDLTEPRGEGAKRVDYLVSLFLRLSVKEQMTVLQYVKDLAKKNEEQ